MVNIARVNVTSFSSSSFTFSSMYRSTLLTRLWRFGGFVVVGALGIVGSSGMELAGV